MNKVILLVIIGITLRVHAFSQCAPQTLWPAPWYEPSGSGVYFYDYMCMSHDTIHNRVTWSYFDGDGYMIKLIAGSDVTVSTHNCTLFPASITLTDSLGLSTLNISASQVCPNALNFIAPYTGIYFIAFDSDGNCNNVGLDSIGEVGVKLNNASIITNCVPFTAPTNDSICGAKPLSLNVRVNGNTTYALPFDADDSQLGAIGYQCFSLNNTLWYYYTPLTSDTVSVFFSTGGNAFDFPAWFGVVSAPAGVDPCNDILTYEGCYYGPLNATPTGSGASAEPYDGILPTIDSVFNHIYLTAGKTYFFVIDGVAGATGNFTFGVESLLTSFEVLEKTNARLININPNPSTGKFLLENKTTEKNLFLYIYDKCGKLMMTQAITDTKVNLDLTDFAKGIYTANIVGNITNITKRILIQ